MRAVRSGKFVGASRTDLLSHAALNEWRLLGKLGYR